MRIKEVLSSIISHNQSAFIKGREILYNILILPKEAHLPKVLLKINLRKAFDSIHWDFIQEMLTTLKFPTIFTKWVMACLTSVHFTVHLNGQDQGSFKGGKGLRQVGPLSPLLFVVSMEYLSRLLLKVSRDPQFRFHPSCNLGLTHLIFADDLIIFSKADPPSLRLIMTALNSFHQCTSLEANLQKSHMVLGGAPCELQNLCLQETGFPQCQLPLKYLRVPITANRLTKIECSSLVEKIIAKVHTLGTRNISYAGRAVLVNSVIFGMYSY